MTDEQEKSVENKLQEIINIQKEYESKIFKLRQELLQHAAYFDSYTEMYTYIRAHTPTFQAFCEDMKDARDIFDKAQKDKYK